MNETSNRTSAACGTARALLAAHLDALEAEACFILREIAAESKCPALHFSGGKDSLVVLHLARKALHLGRLSWPRCTSTPNTTSPR